MLCRAQLMTLTKEANKLEANDHNYNSDLEEVIRQVKEELKTIFFKRKDLILKLGKAFKNIVSEYESICEEIKNVLRDEIRDGHISERDIERYCPEEWKKKTKAKKPKNDKLSISQQEEEAIPQLLVDADGSSVVEPAAIPVSDSNNSDAIDSEGSAKERTNSTGEFSAGNDLEDVDLQQSLSEQNKVAELETKMKEIESEPECKPNENNQLQSQVEELKSRSEMRATNLEQEDRFFDTETELSFEALCESMEILLSKNNHIKSIFLIATVDLATKSLTDIRIRNENGTYPLN